MRAKLTQIESTNNVVKSITRTKEMEGVALGIPTVNQPFGFQIDKPEVHIQDKYFRTSLVQSVVEHDGGKILFKTLNSTYELEPLNENENN